ncbi:hypothetical protein B0H17DRAFT_1187396 [Mycena rosella]|uniref:Uncharacterized protein n=1 Tax=Mycena rosella TaxID=1033263 RepID=A0AAD7C2X7_MYCRO|nr:hypothetical protein B0H17DRAFT_1187396 [Mycena rosella]
MEQSIADVKQSITGPDASKDSIVLLHSLNITHETLSTQAEALYASPNIQDSFPELLNLPLEFIRILLMMQETLRLNMEHQSMVIRVTQELTIVSVAIDTLTVNIRAEATTRPENCANVSVATHSGAPTCLEIIPGTVFIEPESEDELIGEDFLASDTFDTSDLTVVSEELDPGSISDADHDIVLNLQEMLSNSETLEESTAIEADSLNLEIRWNRVDHNNLIPLDPHRDKCVIVGTDGRPNIEMEAEEIAPVESHTGHQWLGSKWSCSSTSPICLVTPSPEMQKVASDEDLWRHIKHTSSTRSTGKSLCGSFQFIVLTRSTGFLVLSSYTSSRSSSSTVWVQAGTGGGISRCDGFDNTKGGSGQLQQVPTSCDN